jgi:hypothetical protein
MQNKQIFYLKIISISLLVSLSVTLGLGKVLYANNQSFIQVEERLSRIELERSLEKIISPYDDCNESLKGIEIPELNGFTTMDQLTFENGEIAFKSNAASKSLYIEQIRLSNVDTDTSDDKILVEVSVPVRSQRSMLIKLDTITLRAYVKKDAINRVDSCSKSSE